MDFTTPLKPTNVDPQIERSIWIANHRAGIIKGLMIALASIIIIILGFSAFILADWAVGGGRAEADIVSRLTKNFANYGAFREHYLPRDLVIEPAQILPVGDGAYDIIVPVTNPNQQWSAKIEYTIPGQEGSVEMINNTFILPGETKYLYRLGVSGAVQSLTSTATIRTIKWSSLDNKIVQPDYATWSAQRLGLEVSNATFTAAASETGGSVSRATFTVTNETAFGYKTVGFYVTLIGGGRMVGFNHVTATDFAAGETRDLVATWYVPIGGVTRVVVQPEVNIFDSNNQLR